MMNSADTLHSGPQPSMPGVYQKLPLEELIRKNVQTAADLEKLHCALGILIKYGRNLLKGGQRPKMWNRVMFSNSVFSSRVDCVQGSREILQSLGYTLIIPGGMAYPSDTEPDTTQVNAVLLELHTAQKELDAYIEGRHPQPDWINRIVPPAVRSSNSRDTSPSHQAVGGHAMGSAASNGVAGLPAVPEAWGGVAGQPAVPEAAAAAGESPTSDCDICGQKSVEWICNRCDGKRLCDNCDNTWHQHPKRKQHSRDKVSFQALVSGPKLGLLPTFLDTYESGSNREDSHRSPTKVSQAHNILPTILPTALPDVSPIHDHMQNTGARPKSNSFQAPSSPSPYLMKNGDYHNTLLGKPDMGLLTKTTSSNSDEDISATRARLLQTKVHLDLQISEIDKHLRKIIINNMNFIKDPNYNSKFAEKEILQQRLTQVELEYKHLDELPIAALRGGTVNGSGDSSHSFAVRRPAEGLDIKAASDFNRGSYMGVSPLHGTFAHPLQTYTGAVSPAVGLTAGVLSSPQPTNTPTSPLVAKQDNTASDSWTCSVCDLRNAGQLRACSWCTCERPEEPQKPWPSFMQTTVAQQPAVQPKSSLMQKASDLLKGMMKHLPGGESRAPKTQLVSQPNSPENPVVLEKPTVQGPSTANSPPDIQLVLQKLAERKAQQEDSMQARNLLQSLRAAERDGFTPAELQCACVQHGADQMLPYLRNGWTNGLQEVSQALEEYQLSISELRSMLALHQGDVAATVSAGKESGEEKMSMLKAYTDLPEEEMLGILRETSKDRISALSKLVETKCKQVNARLWAAENWVARNDRWEKLEMLVKNQDVDIERRCRAVLVEGRMKGWRRADMVVQYAVEHPSVGVLDIIEAANDCSNISNFRSQLEMECPLCYDVIPKSQMSLLATCQDQICVECFKCYFEQHIREDPVVKLVCPLCDAPDMSDKENCQQYFQILELLFQTTLSSEVIDLFQQKVRDWHLQQEPNFRWCSKCDSGFIHEGGILKMECPHCHCNTCFQCKREWQPQHEGLSCEQFYDWLKANDPEFQKAGLEKHLQENGIECPQCKFRYALAKGGCIHFTCSQCRHEFCCGCRKPFHKAGTCRKLDRCAYAGLHCHHPRDCLYYMRDWEVKQLQDILQEHSVEFQTETMLSGEAPNDRCLVMEQKEDANNKRRDEPCGMEVPSNHAGLCVRHYKEYLVSLINKNHIDPVSSMDLQELRVTLERAGSHVPEQLQGESQDMYLGRLKQTVMATIPLAFGNN